MTERSPASFPTKPVGPFHDFETGCEVWIAQRCLHAFSCRERKYDSKREPMFWDSGRVYTVVMTASLKQFQLREPISEVVERVGWATDKRPEEPIATVFPIVTEYHRGNGVVWTVSFKGYSSEGPCVEMPSAEEAFGLAGFINDHFVLKEAVHDSSSE